MTNNADAHIARGWAERAMSLDPLDDVPIEGYRSAARYILATTTPPTMADLDWHNDVHAGRCAEHEVHGLVRMLYEDGGGMIDCILPSMSLLMISADELTPIPGTRVDLTPRREPEPEFTPDHPTELTTAAEYLHAPAGTVVATEGAEVWTKDLDGLWETFCIASGYNNHAMSDEARQVLRWGWKG